MSARRLSSVGLVALLALPVALLVGAGKRVESGLTFIEFVITTLVSAGVIAWIWWGYSDRDLFLGCLAVVVAWRIGRRAWECGLLHRRAPDERDPVADRR